MAYAIIQTPDGKRCPVVHQLSLDKLVSFAFGDESGILECYDHFKDAAPSAVYYIVNGERVSEHDYTTEYPVYREVEGTFI